MTAETRAEDEQVQHPVVGWDEVEAAADEAFNIWVGQPELRWARDAWACLGRAGLTS